MPAKKEQKTEEHVSVDDAFLRDFIAKGGKAETPTGRPVDQENLDKFMQEVGGDSTTGGKGATPKQERLHKEAVKQGDADTTKEDAAAAEKEQARINKLRGQDEERRNGKMRAAALKGARTAKGSLVDPLFKKVGAGVDKVSSLSTVGGVGLLLVILLFLLMVIVQVNAAGDTRLKQLWYMLNGRASLNGRVDIAKQDAALQSSGSSALPTITPGGAVGDVNAVLGAAGTILGGTVSGIGGGGEHTHSHYRSYTL